MASSVCLSADRKRKDRTPAPACGRVVAHCGAVVFSCRRAAMVAVALYDTVMMTEMADMQGYAARILSTMHTQHTVW